MYRRKFVKGVVALLVFPNPTVSIPLNARVKRVKIVCECSYDNIQYVVFDDLPRTIFEFQDTMFPGGKKFVAGDSILVEV